MWNENMKEVLQNLGWDITDRDHDQAVEENIFIQNPIQLKFVFNLIQE